MIQRRCAITLIAAVIALTLAGSVAYAAPKIGSKAPDFTLPKITGGSLTLSKLFAAPVKAVVLDMWATWCPPCRQEIPYLVDISKRYKSKGLAMVGVAIDEKIDVIKDFAKDQRINYVVAHDSQAQKVGEPYALISIPTTYVLDRKGVIRYMHLGFMGEDEATAVEKEVKTLLAED